MALPEKLSNNKNVKRKNVKSIFHKILALLKSKILHLKYKTKRKEIFFLIHLLSAIQLRLFFIMEILSNNQNGLVFVFKIFILNLYFKQRF